MERGLGSHLTQSRRAEDYLRVKYHVDPSGRLATINMGRNVGAPSPFWGGRVGSPSNTKSHGPRPTSIPSGMLIHAAVWPQQIWPKNWRLCPFWGGGAGSPSNTMWPGPRPTCMPSFVLTVQPFGHSTPTLQTDSQDRRGQTGQRSHSIGRTVLRTVARMAIFLYLPTPLAFKCPDGEVRQGRLP